MTQIKTPLPKEVLFSGVGNMDIINLIKAVNQHRDFLTELTAVVEQLNSLAYPTAYEIQTHADIKKMGAIPTLKERLLDEIGKAPRMLDTNVLVHIKDVEAIINRVIPD